MNSLTAELSSALFAAILHSIWQGCALAIIYVIFSPKLRTTHSRYLLAISLCTAAPLAFVATFMQSFSQSSAVLDSTVQTAAGPALATYFAVAWCIGTLFVGGRFFCGWVWLRVFILGRSVAVPASVQSLFDDTKRKLNAPKRLIVRASAQILSPMVTGVIKPVVLLPVSMLSGVPPNILTAVFVHELLHVRRFDHVAVFAQAICETLLFYHPAVRWLSMETRRAREYRCDDDSIGLLGDKYDYARALLSLEESRTDVTVPALLMNGGELMDRVERILGTPRKAGFGAMNFIGLLAFACIALLTYSLSIGEEPEQNTPVLMSNSHTVNIRWLPPSVAQWTALIEKAAVRHDVPADVLALMLFTESRGEQQALSSSGARGLMQVMPQTGKIIAEQRGIEGFAADQLFDPETNVDFGAWYLAQQLARFSAQDEDKPALAISAYNAGPGAVAAYLAGTQPLPDETIMYRDTLLSMLSEADDYESVTLENHKAKLRKRLPTFIFPVEGRVTSRFGFDGGDRGMHNGVDIAASSGTAVVAPVNGKIASVGEDDIRGKYITVRHADGIETHYFHLSEITVEPGTTVKTGDTLGEVGSTGRSNGAHLHFEIREYGQPVSPKLYGLTTS